MWQRCVRPILHYTCYISHNAPFRTEMHISVLSGVFCRNTYFCSQWCILGYVFWDMGQVYYGICELAHLLCRMILTVAIDRAYDDVIKWKHFRVTGLFLGEIHRSPVKQRPVTQSFDVSLICAWTNSWANNGEPVIWDAIALIMASL